jgi:hypothetical protein
MFCVDEWMKCKARLPAVKPAGNRLGGKLFEEHEEPVPHNQAEKQRLLHGVEDKVSLNEEK